MVITEHFSLKRLPRAREARHDRSDLEQKHRHDEAIAEFRRAIELSGGNTTFASNLANAYAVSGRKEEAMKIDKDLESRQSEGSATDASIALIYGGLADTTGR